MAVFWCTLNGMDTRRTAVWTIIAALTGPAWLADAETPGPYSGHTVVSIELTSTRDAMAASVLGEHLGCTLGSGWNDFLIPLDRLGALHESGLKSRVVAEDAQAHVNNFIELNELARSDRGGNFFSAYPTLDEVFAYMDELDTLEGHHPDNIQVLTIGASLQGRPIKALRIGTPQAPEQPQKLAFVFNAGQHAREWITVPAALWAADRLIRDYATDPEMAFLVENLVFYIIPVMNPDGYVYTLPTSQGGGGNRYWRKNRRDNGNSTFGVDLNRNWGFQWGGVGSSSFGSSETYRGTGPFSEPETATMRDFMTSGLTEPLGAYIDIHAYSQLVMSPWGYTSANPPRLNELQPLTDAQVAAITATYGTSYIGGPIAQVLYAASGNSADWALGERNALAWAYELRPLSGGLSGFAPSPSEILPTAIETWNGLKVVAHHLTRRYEIGQPVVFAPLSPLEPTGVAMPVTGLNGFDPQDATIRLHSRSQSATGPFESALATGGPSVFTADLPPSPCGVAREFYVEVTDSEGSVVRFPPGAPATLMTANAYSCPCPGDATGNGTVDFADITSVVSNWGASGRIPGPPSLLGDANGDSIVDFNDLAIVLSSWLMPCP